MIKIQYKQFALWANSESGILEIFACGIQGFGIHPMESGIPWMIGIWTPKSTAKKSWIQNVESRIQDS